MRLVQPPNTAKYEVSPSDTVARIALRYNTTPTELSRLNHLSTSLLYPGQTLFVPDKTDKETKYEEASTLCEHSNDVPIPINDSPNKSETLEIERCFSPDTQIDNLLESKALDNCDDEVSRKYLKFKSKYVTDGQGVVSGVLLVTPQTVMFNPCVSDHLVMERGREMYLVRLPLRAISKIILFEDIAAMVVGDMSKQYTPKVSFIDYAAELNVSPKPGMIVCQETGETYALHSNFEKSTLGDASIDTNLPEEKALENSKNDKCLHKQSAIGDSGSYNYLQLALENLTISQLQSSVFSSENKVDKTAADDSGDQGISTISDQSGSDTTVKDITITSQTADAPALNTNECVSCQNFSEFMEDSQFSSTPKHIPLNNLDNTFLPSKPSETNEQTILETNAVANRNISDKLATIEKSCVPAKKMVDSFITNKIDHVDILDTTDSNETLKCSSTVSANNIDTKILSDDLSDEPKELCKNKANDIEQNDVACNSSEIVPSNISDISHAVEKKVCDDIILKNEFDDSMDLIATTLVENHFNESGEDIKDDKIVKNEDHEGAVNNCNSNRNRYFENRNSRVCDVSKDSGISEVGSTGTQDTNDSKDTIDIRRQSSLSDEARQWLGKRGVKLSSEDGENIPMLTPAASENDFDSTDEVTPRPASRIEDPLMYVAIKVHKSYWCPINAKQNQIMGVPPNRDQKRREHWFAIPRERVDQFYNFLLYWAPDVYSSEYSSGLTSPYSDMDSNDEKLNRTEVAGMKMKRSWSMYSVSSKSSTRSLADDEIPDLQAESQILSKKQVHLLTRKLPSRTVGHSWELVYSTTIHGISLSTLYRNFQGFDAPVLIAVKDENQKVFGAFMSEPPKVSEGFYGTGESMLYSFLTETTLKTYPWTGDNNFFIKGSKTSLVIGGGEGIFGLWLDEDLYRGRSHSCKTFSNETLSGNEDFICCGLEAWGFV